jgi:hypothetical protein
MLWMELRPIPQIIEFNVRKKVFFGYWHYLHKMIMQLTMEEMTNSKQFLDSM